jgi:sugar lactone lactonase YvrE
MLARLAVLYFERLLVLVLASLLTACHAWTGAYLKDYSQAPVRPSSDLSTVAALPLPPGNIAVSASGRVFITFHPEGKSAVKVAELVGGKAEPFPDAAFQSERSGPFFDTVLAIRIDSKGRLWTLDYAQFAKGKPRLLAFDVERREVVYDYPFPSEVARFGSMLNDFQIDPEGRFVYIADASILRGSYAILVHDTERRTTRRLLEDHPSVAPENFIAVVDGMRQTFFGIMANQPGVDSIALDKKGEWLYYSAVTTDTLWRVRASDLKDESLSKEALARRVEAYALKSMSDGITMDKENNIYISDMEHGAIHRLGPDRRLVTLFRDPQKIRWPDGFSFGPDGWLYFTCSALQYVIFESKDFVRKHAPYQVYRFQAGAEGVPGQ